ncbi:MAG TPA: tetratricopeptide repeat protein, partial [Gemmatales bacterium]|nr:tetratricopeptide repeat protein [Gemmatales bacterium]
MRSTLLTLVLLFVTVSDSLLSQELSSVPPYQRLLTGQKDQQAKEYAIKIDNLVNFHQFAEAKKVSEEYLGFRVKWQGEDHYQVMDLRWDIETIKCFEKATWASRREFLLVPQIEPSERESAITSPEKLEPRLRKVIDIRKQMLGENHPEVITSYNNLAMNLLEQYRFEDAQTLAERVLKKQTELLGEKHPEVARSHHNLATIYQRKGLWNEADKHFLKALELRKYLYGNQHEEVANSLNSLAVNLNLQSKLKEAQSHFERSLEIRRNLLGEMHEDTIGAYNNLAENLDAQGEFAQSQMMLQQALQKYQSTSQSKNPISALVMEILAKRYTRQGNYAEAQRYFLESLKWRRQFNQEFHPDIAVTYNNYAMNMLKLGNYAEALTFLEKGLAIIRARLPPEHPTALIYQHNLATTFDLLGQLKKAEDVYTELIQRTQQRFGKKHPETIHALNNLANHLQKQKKLKEAHTYFQEALQACLESQGEDSSLTALLRNNLGGNFLLQKQYADAQLQLELSLKIYRQLFGQRHPDTARTAKNLGDVLLAQRRYEEALPYFQASARSFELARIAVAYSGFDRASFSANYTPYRSMAACLANLNRPEAAWAAAESNLARSLLEEASARQGFVLNQTQKQEQKQLLEALNQTQNSIIQRQLPKNLTPGEKTSLDTLLQQRNMLEDKLAELAASSSQREMVELAAVQKLLPADAAIILWVDQLSDYHTEHWGCVLRSNALPHWEKLPGTGPEQNWIPDDHTLCSRLRTAILGDMTTAKASESEVRQIAQQLYNQRLAPFEKHLKGGRRLYAVGVHTMAGIPLDILTDKYVISYIPSATFLAKLKARPYSENQHMLAIGVQHYSKPELPSKAATPLPDHGLLVMEVLPESPAARARLQRNDVLIKYGTETLHSLTNLSQALDKHKSDPHVEIIYWRNGVFKEAEIAAGRIGVVLAHEPAPQLLAEEIKHNHILESQTRGGEWNDLPGVRFELHSLQNLLDSQKCKVLFDQQATLEKLVAMQQQNQLRQYRYLHFAVHGEANNTRAFESKLILSKPADAPEKVSNHLYARDIIHHWHLDAELVTLSACETALGRSAGGDGVLGFALAFLHAGSRAVCLSLWKIEDSATTLLMERFYSNLTGKREGLAKPMGKAAALAEAKTWLRSLTLKEASDRLGALSFATGRGGNTPDVRNLPAVTPPNS